MVQKIQHLIEWQFLWNQQNRISEASTVVSASNNNFMVQRNEFASVVSLTTGFIFNWTVIFSVES